MKFRDLSDFLSLLDAVEGPNAKGNYSARCPAHDDKTASLTICEKVSAKDGKRRIYFYCQTKKCTHAEILAKLGLTDRDLLLDDAGNVERLPNGGRIYTVKPRGTEPAPSAAKKSRDLGKLTNVYDYCDKDGSLLFQVCRFEQIDDEGKRHKTFRQRIYAPKDPKAKNGYVWSVPDGMRETTLYRMPQLLAAIKAGQTVYVVEGEKDVDTLTRLGCVATTNPGGAGKWQKGHTELLTGADVVVLGDCDTKENHFTGQQHAWDVATALQTVAKCVRLPDLRSACETIPPKGDVTDFIAILGDEKGKAALEALARDCEPFDPNALQPWLDPKEAAETLYNRVGGYVVFNGCICQRTDDDARKLCTFVALPTKIVTRDDGVNLEKVFVIDGWARGGKKLPQVQVQAARFRGMDWVLENWDFAANIMPGNLIKDKLRYVIAEVGEMSAKRQTVYTHTGWRKIDGKWVYLYQGGAVGAERVSVDLESALSSYTLDCDDGIELRDAAKRSFIARFCMEDRISIPLMSVMFLAPLREFLQQAGYAPGFALFLLGGTGTHKSTATALMMSYFGLFHAKNLPASFNDTANSIRKKAFLLKDAPIAVDDYHPETSAQERRKMESIAQVLNRAFGDGADRGRMKADLSLQDSMPPRGVAIMSGEDLPNIGESGAARYYIINIGKGDIPISDSLTEAQEMAKQGVMRRVMRGYIEYLQPLADTLSNRLEARFVELRAKAALETQGSHGRAPEAVAHLMLGYETMLDYMVSIGALDRDNANFDRDEAWTVLVQNSKEQGKEAADDRPSRMFIGAISELLLNRTAQLRDLTDPNSRTPAVGMIGYCDAEMIYLMPETAYTAVSKLYGEQGMTLPLSKRLLYKQMREDKIVVPDTDGKTTRSKCVDGKIVRLLWIPRNKIETPPPSAPTEVQTKIDTDIVPF